MGPMLRVLDTVVARHGVLRTVLGRSPDGSLEISSSGTSPAGNGATAIRLPRPGGATG